MTLTQVNSKGIKDSEIVNADVASNANIDLSKINTSSLSISNSNVASDAAIDQSKLNLSISNSNVASNAAIDGSKLNLSITNSDIASNAAIAGSKIDLSSANFSLGNSDVVANAGISQSKLQLNITDTEVASAAGINSNKISFTQTGTGASARTVANRFQDTISVKDFGALGNGSNNDTSAIQAALTQGAVDGVSVYLPAGTYMVHDTIRIPSNTHFFGSGEKSIIKMNKDIDNVKTLVQTGARNDKRKNIVIEDMTLDFNRERWQYRDSSQSNYLNIRTDNYIANGNTYITDPVINDDSSSMDYGGSNLQSTHACTLNICFSENVLIKNVKALDAYKHSIDICSPKYRRGFKGSNSDFDNGGNSSLQGPQIYDTVKQDGTASKSNGSKVITVSITGHGYDVGDEIYLNTSSSTFNKLYRIEKKINDNSFTVIALRSDESFTNTSCYAIQDQGSKHVTLENCYASGAGDDNITTHYSSHLLITGCHSEFPSGRLVPQNSNCYEIDDGSRNVTLTNCTARGGCKGIQIKGHSYAPAPYNVTIDGLRIVNCAEGMDIKHTGWGKVASMTGPSGSSTEGDFINVINNWGGGQTLTNPTHQIRSGNITYTGGSPTAKNLSISNVQIIAPRGFRPVRDDDGTGLQKADKQIQLYSYENVQFTNILISDGRFDLAADYDLATSALAEDDAGNNEADTDLDQIVDIFYGAQSVSFKNLAIHGFRSANYGLRVTSSFLQHFSVDGLVILDGPNTGVEFSESYGNWVALVDNYLILRPDTASPGVTGSVGIHNNKLGTSFVLGNGNIVRYATDVKTTT